LLLRGVLVSLLHNAIISALREAGPDGLDEGEMAEYGGQWWQKRVSEIRRWKRAVIGEQDGRYFLVSEPDVERTASASSMGANGAVTPTAEGDAGLIPRASADGSLNAAQPLFEVPPVSAIDPEAKAA
jgi:hypothetical protein